MEYYYNEYLNLEFGIKKHGEWRVHTIRLLYEGSLSSTSHSGSHHLHTDLLFPMQQENWKNAQRHLKAFSTDILRRRKKFCLHIVVPVKILFLKCSAKRHEERNSKLYTLIKGTVS